MKQTVAIYATFAASAVSNPVYINIPFPVKTIHVKSMNYDADTNGTTRNVLIDSNITPSSPFGILNQDDTYSSPAVQDIEIQVRNPIVIQGYYTFTLKTMSGAIAGTTNAGAGTDYVGMIVEFNAPDEIY